MNKDRCYFGYPVWVATIIWSICIPAFAADTTETTAGDEQFQQVVEKYRAENPKPQLPEEARKFKVQAEYAIQQKQFARAAELYGQALEIAPWWPAGHFNRAVILGETRKYREAIGEMKRYLLLEPDAPDARAVKDKIYVWDDAAGPDAPLRIGVYGMSSATNFWSGKQEHPPQPEYADSFIAGGQFTLSMRLSEDACDRQSCDLIVKVTCSEDAGTPPAKAEVSSAISQKSLYFTFEGRGGRGSHCQEDARKLGMAVSKAFAAGTSLNKSVWAEKANAGIAPPAKATVVDPGGNRDGGETVDGSVAKQRALLRQKQKF